MLAHSFRRVSLLFFDLPEAGERALLVHCFGRYDALPGRPLPDEGELIASAQSSDSPANSANDSAELLAPEVAEFIELVRSADVTPIYIEVTRRDRPTPRYYIGTGKVAELRQIVCDNQIDVVLFNHALSPSQERNLEAEFQCKVLDRTGLILDIFAQRARSHAGKLQVELAQLEHIATRLIRGWTHLERQKGGIGMRGPGETQLETDRRLLRERIKWINRRLDKVNAQRSQGRRSRARAELPVIALVGYTNAGKSTLFNRMTDSAVYAQDQLFATLDTTLRAVELPGFGKVVVADTVGFIRQLPHKLVEAFKATLEEAVEADLLLHVIDAGSEDVAEHIAAVELVLAEIGAGDVPVLQVMNKIDQLEMVDPHVDYREHGAKMPSRVWLSAQTGSGVDELTHAMAACLDQDMWRGECRLLPANARLRAQLYSCGAILNEQISDGGEFELQICFRLSELKRLFAAEGLPFPYANDSAAKPH